jgi:EpsG family
MFIYFLFFTIIYLFTFVDFGIKTNRFHSIISISLISLFIILFAGFRFEIGTDYFGYKDIFDRIYIEQTVNVEFGFIFIIKLYQYISDNYTFFILLLFLLSFILKLSALVKLTKYVSFSLLVYYSTILISSDINQLRMGLSLSIILFSIFNIINEKKGAFYISVFIAGTIHYSALVFLPAYIIANLNLNRSKYIILFSIAIINYIFFKFFLIDYFGLNIIFFLNENYQNKYSVYLDNINEFESFFTIVSRLFLFILFYLYQKKDPISKNTKLLNLYFFSILIYLTLSQQGLITARLSGYYKLSEIIFLPYLFHYFKNTRSNLLIHSMISIYLLISLYRILIVPGDLYPYKNLIF